MPRQAVMSEHVLRIDSAELDRVRLVCGHCQVAVESDLAELGNALSAGQCRFCHQQLVKKAQDGTSDAITRFAGYLLGLKDVAGNVRIEFVVPEAINRPAADR